MSVLTRKLLKTIKFEIQNQCQYIIFKAGSCTSLNTIFTVLENEINSWVIICDYKHTSIGSNIYFTISENHFEEVFIHYLPKFFCCDDNSYFQTWVRIVLIF